MQSSALSNAVARLERCVWLPSSRTCGNYSQLRDFHFQQMQSRPSSLCWARECQAFCPECGREAPLVAHGCNRPMVGLTSLSLSYCHRAVHPRCHHRVFFIGATQFPRMNEPEEALRQRQRAGCATYGKSNASSRRIQVMQKDEPGLSNEDGPAVMGADCGGQVADVLQKSKELAQTQRLVETAMLAATAGLAFFITNLLRLEGYIGCFLPLPPVIASLRWNAAAGRKTTVATALLLFLIGGPLKAVSYLLLHGIFGMVMGALWRWHVSWMSSLLLCTLVRMLGLILSVALTSWLIQENLLALLINQAHASLGQLCVFLGINASPSIGLIVMAVFGLVFLNCIVFVFLLHVLYTVVLHRLGIPSAIEAPGWINRSLKL